MANSFIVDTVGGISGSLTQLVDGTPYMVGTGLATVTTASNGSLVVDVPASTDALHSSSVFLTSGYFTSSITGLGWITGFGGGGGGGSGGVHTGGVFTPGGGGGGGSLQSTVPVELTSGSVYAVTIGAGGNGGSGRGSPGNGSAGAAGGDSSFALGATTLALFGGASGGDGGFSDYTIGPTGGGCAVKARGGNITTRVYIQNTVVGVVSSVASGAPSGVNPNPGGSYNPVGGYLPGVAGFGDEGDGGGGGAGPAGAGADGSVGDQPGSSAGSSAANNTGAGGGGSGSSTSTGASGTGGAGGSGKITVSW